MATLDPRFTCDICGRWGIVVSDYTRDGKACSFEHLDMLPINPAREAYWEACQETMRQIASGDNHDP